MAHYEVKSWTFLFQAIKAGIKHHDIRDLRDRPYKVGDTMLLKEWDPAKNEFTGDSMLVEITYQTDVNSPCAFSSAVLDKNFTICSIRVIQKNDNFSK